MYLEKVATVKILKDLYPYRLALAITVVLVLTNAIWPTIMAPHFTKTPLYNALMQNALLATAYLGAFILYLAMVPKRKSELTIIILTGIVIDIVLTALRAEYIGPWGRLLHLGVGVGLMSQVAILKRIILEKDLNRSQLIDILAVSVSVTGLLLAGSNGGYKHDPAVYDLTTYAFDALSGTQPSFLICRLLRSHLIIRLLMYITYFYLPVWMIIAQIVVFKNPQKAQNLPLVSMFVIGVVGSSLYQFFPVVGITALCGYETFPYGTWPEWQRDLTPIVAPLYLSRNGMPSLHTAWILTTFWCMAPISRKTWATGLTLTVLTLLSTISVGDHYVIDLVIAVPFTLGCYALSGDFRNGKFIAICTAWSAVSVMGWLSIMRFQPWLCLNNRIITIGALVATLAITGYLKILLDRHARQLKLTTD